MNLALTYCAETYYQYISNQQDLTDLLTIAGVAASENSDVPRQSAGLLRLGWVGLLIQSGSAPLISNQTLLKAEGSLIRLGSEVLSQGCGKATPIPQMSLPMSQ